MITIVSGLPRSGTSLAMQMLAAGGLPVLTDGARSEDASNPRGYFEFSRVLRLPSGDDGWAAAAEGRAVKITWPLLRSVPAHWNVRVVWMERSVEEIVASQARMLGRAGQQVEDAPPLRRAFATMQEQAKAWLAARPGTAVIAIDHAALLRAPVAGAARLAAWCGGSLDVAAMAAVVDPALWRERGDGG